MKKFTLALMIVLFWLMPSTNVSAQEQTSEFKQLAHHGGSPYYNNRRANRQQQYRNNYRNRNNSNRRYRSQRSRGYYDNDYSSDSYGDRYYDSYDQGYNNQNRRADRRGYYQPPSREVRQVKRSSNIVRYNEKLCETGKYKCIKIKRGHKWSKLFPNEYQRNLVKRFNRTNIRLRIGSHIAVPPDLENADLLDIAPFEKNVETGGKKLVLVSLPKLAYGAYDESGDLVRWGPVSGGRDWCPDVKRPCNTITGAFAVFNKKDRRCQSGSFPIDRGGGAPMPYCMFFASGFALHGSNEVPGYNASHGCVRMYTEDAKWLNEEFVDVPLHDLDTGTPVIIQVEADNSPDPYTLTSNGSSNDTQVNETAVDTSNQVDVDPDFVQGDTNSTSENEEETQQYDERNYRPNY